jgi:hypothetical protein
MFRHEVLRTDAIVAVVAIESSMTTSAILENMTNALHSSFKEEPDDEYNEIEAQILGRLGIPVPSDEERAFERTRGRQGGVPRGKEDDSPEVRDGGGQGEEGDEEEPRGMGETDTRGVESGGSENENGANGGAEPVDSGGVRGDTGVQERSPKSNERPEEGLEDLAGPQTRGAVYLQGQGLRSSPTGASDTERGLGKGQNSETIDEPEEAQILQSLPEASLANLGVVNAREVTGVGETDRWQADVQAVQEKLRGFRRAGASAATNKGDAPARRGAWLDAGRSVPESDGRVPEERDAPAGRGALMREAAGRLPPEMNGSMNAAVGRGEVGRDGCLAAQQDSGQLPGSAWCNERPGVRKAPAVEEGKGAQDQPETRSQQEGRSGRQQDVCDERRVGRNHPEDRDQPEDRGQRDVSEGGTGDQARDRCQHDASGRERRRAEALKMLEDFDEELLQQFDGLGSESPVRTELPVCLSPLARNGAPSQARLSGEHVGTAGRGHVAVGDRLAGGGTPGARVASGVWVGLTAEQTGRGDETEPVVSWDGDERPGFGGFGSPTGVGVANFIKERPRFDMCGAALSEQEAGFESGQERVGRGARREGHANGCTEPEFKGLGANVSGGQLRPQLRKVGAQESSESLGLPRQLGGSGKVSDGNAELSLENRPCGKDRDLKRTVEPSRSPQPQNPVEHSSNSTKSSNPLSPAHCSGAQGASALIRSLTQRLSRPSQKSQAEAENPAPASSEQAPQQVLPDRGRLSTSGGKSNAPPIGDRGVNVESTRQRAQAVGPSLLRKRLLGQRGGDPLDDPNQWLSDEQWGLQSPDKKAREF